MNLFGSKKPEKMSVEQLQEAIKDLTRERKALGVQLHDLQSAYNGKMAFLKIEGNLDSLTDAQKAALVQQIEASGIASDEAFGEL